MASFLNKLNRMRNVRMHATNEYHYPQPGLYHEIIQGVPWYGGISRTRPKRLDAGIDKVMQYVVAKRPEYKNFPWCSANNKGVYTHPANFASDKICHLMDLSPTLSLPEAFEIVDKEVSDIKAEVDLQVTLAREHAAKLGVVNQGVESLLKRAQRVYDSVFKMKEEEAVKNRRAVMADMCRQVLLEGKRLDMQDIIDFIPFRDEQIQFFQDFPEYRKLFPPLWWLSNEIAQLQAGETEARMESGESEQVFEEEVEEQKPKAKTGRRELFTDISFMEDDPDGNALSEWPPRVMFDRQARNRVKAEELKALGIDQADAELQRAIEEARSQVETHTASGAPIPQNIVKAEVQELANEIVANKKQENYDDFDILVHEKQLSDSRPDRQGTLEAEKGDFFAEFRQFLVTNHHVPARERANYYFGAKPAPDSLSSQPTTDAQEIVIQHAQKGGKLDLDSMRTLRGEIRGRLGEHAANDVFEYTEGGGAVTLAQLEGLSAYDPLEPRHVNLTANIDLSPFYPENAFPPRGLLSDPNVDLKDPSTIPEKYRQQYEELVNYGAKYAHAIEDYAPVKSTEYIEESIRKNTPMMMEYTPEVQKLDAATRAENLKDLLEKQKQTEFKSLDEYEGQLNKAEGEEEEGKETEVATKESEKSSLNVNSEAELRQLKKVALDELAKIAFESDAERDEYEQMLERRFDYLAQKRKERNQQWAQYWPSDKPETLIYRGPEVIREIFPEAYKLAVNRKFEELSGVPYKEAVTIKSYVGLWKSVRAKEHRDKGLPINHKVKDLDMSDWQHSVSLDPSL